jgi:hypothetical protein
MTKRIYASIKIIIINLFSCFPLPFGMDVFTRFLFGDKFKKVKSVYSATFCVYLRSSLRELLERRGENCFFCQKFSAQNRKLAQPVEK